MNYGSLFSTINIKLEIILRIKGSKWHHSGITVLHDTDFF